MNGLDEAQLENYLAHYGVLGMKWGVRKQDDGSKAKTGSSSDNTTGYKPKNPGKESKTRRKKSKEPKHLRGEEVLNTKLDSGGSLTVRTNPPGPIAKALASKFKTIRELQEKVHDFTLYNEKNEKVGEASFTQTSKDTLELEWIGVRKAHRNRGYATAAMQGVIEYAKDNDIATLNLTATNMGSGIYESLGFKKVGESDHYDGLYQMTIPKRIKHSSSNDFELDPKLFGEYIKNSLNKNLSRKDDSESETIAHYGVLGMKWGVRNEESRERIQRLNDKDRKKLRRAADRNYRANSRGGQRRLAFATRQISESQYKKMSSEPIQISNPGESFKRISKSPNKLRKGMVYVNKDPEDHKTYTAIFPPEANEANRERFSLTIKAKEGLVSPSYKERLDTFIDTLDQKIPRASDGKVLTGRQYMTGVEEPNYLKSLSNREIGLKYYQTFVQSQHANNELNQKFINNIKAKGYNAMLDDADMGMLSTMPVIIFPDKANLSIVEARPISEDDVLLAKATYKLKT